MTSLMTSQGKIFTCHQRSVDIFDPRRFAAQLGLWSAGNSNSTDSGLSSYERGAVRNGFANGYDSPTGEREQRPTGGVKSRDSNKQRTVLSEERAQPRSHEKLPKDSARGGRPRNMAFGNIDTFVTSIRSPPPATRAMSAEPPIYNGGRHGLMNVQDDSRWFASRHGNIISSTLAGPERMRDGDAHFTAPATENSVLLKKSRSKHANHQEREPHHDEIRYERSRNDAVYLDDLQASPISSTRARTLDDGPVDPSYYGGRSSRTRQRNDSTQDDDSRFNYGSPVTNSHFRPGSALNDDRRFNGPTKIPGSPTVRSQREPSWDRETSLRQNEALTDRATPNAEGSNPRVIRGISISEYIQRAGSRSGSQSSSTRNDGGYAAFSNEPVVMAQLDDVITGSAPKRSRHPDDITHDHVIRAELCLHLWNAAGSEHE